MAVTKRRLLIAGGGYGDIPLIEAGRALGFHVITSGNRPEDLGHRYGDECRLADFSDRDAMLALARELRIDAICACCNDFSALSAAYVAEALQLPGHDPFSISQTVHHKDLYRHFAAENDIPSPRAVGCSSAEAALDALDRVRYPIIVKPVDLTGGKGVGRAETRREAVRAVESAFIASRAKRIVIEEFIEGTRHGISTFIRDGRVVFHFYDDEYYYKNPYLVSAASAPGSMERRTLDQLLVAIERIAGLLALNDGIVHVQFIVDEAGEPYIIEVCRRAPGDLYIRFVRYATGVDYPAFIVRAAAGMDLAEIRRAEVKGFWARHCIMAAREGIVRAVTVDASVRDNVVDQMVWWQAGDRVEDPLTQKLGIVFLKFDSFAEMREKMPRMQDLIKVESH